jgi:predicted methyltransferase
MKHRALLGLVSFGLCLAACTHAPPGPVPPPTTATPPSGTAWTPRITDAETTAKIKAALADATRPPVESARDVYRHPLETLTFFGLKDTMTVVELSAGGGWYSAVLAPVLKDKGHWVGTNGDPHGPPDKESTKNAIAFMERLEKNPQVFGQNPTVFVMKAPDTIQLGPDGSADMVVTFRNVHGWTRDDGKPFDAVLAAAFKVLKPGGVLGIVEHRAAAGADWHDSSKTGYVPVQYVKDAAARAGFVFVDESEVNANPKDTKDYPNGVWALPPTYENKDVDHDKYAAIGESDRMTLRFARPMH